MAFSANDKKISKILAKMTGRLMQATLTTFPKKIKDGVPKKLVVKLKKL